CVDRDFGPFFLKFSTYFPYNAKLCINGHEYAKRQLAQKGIGFEALDNGVLRCDDPKRLQTICDGLSADKIDALLRKWLRLLPDPSHYGGGHSLPACRLQEHSNQAVSQRGARAPHGNHDQQHARFRYRQATQESACPAADRLSSQPASARRPKAFPRLFDWRR